MHFNFVLCFNFVILLPVACWFKGIGDSSELNYTVVSPGSNNSAVRVFLHKINLINTSLAAFQEIFDTTIALINNFTSDALNEIRSFRNQNARVIHVMSTTDGVPRSEKQAQDLSTQLKRQANRLDYILVTSKFWLVNLDVLEGDLALVSDTILVEKDLISEARAISTDYFDFMFSGKGEHLMEALDEVSEAVDTLMQWQEDASSLIHLLVEILRGLENNLAVAEGLYDNVVMRGYTRSGRILKLQDTLVLIEDSLESLARALVSNQEQDDGGEDTDP